MEYFGKANEAKKQTNISNIKEQIQIEIANIQAKNRGNITDEDLKKVLEEYGTIDYEEDEETIKGITTKEEKYEIAIEEIYNGKTQEEPENLARKVISAKNYGDEVNYSANGVDSWKVFFNDETNVYIISSNYVVRSGMELGEGISAGEGEYCVKGDTQDNLIKWLRETSKWEKYAEGIKGATATGGIKLEQFFLSYTKKYDTNHLNNGIVNLSGEIGYNDTLYFPQQNSWNSCNGYWLVSPDESNTSYVWRVAYDGNINPHTSSYIRTGVRPLICLPSNICANKENGKWTFTE